MSEQLRETLPRCGEWVGGITVLPSWVYGEGEPYRPEALLWIEIATGLIVGMEMVKPGEALIEARCSFERASQAPHAGAPRMPRRVRVASPDLAASLRMQGLEVICAPTPELDAAIASMRAHMSRSPEATDEPATYLGRGITSEDMRHFFEASAHLYRACPWEIIPADEHLSITCDALGISGGALIVVGQMGESFGFVLFRTHEDLFCYLEALDQIEDGARPELPRHWMFSFDDREEVEPELSSEIASHDWPIAGPAAIPKVVVFDGDSVRDVTRDELTGIAAVASVLADFLEGDPRLRGAWTQGEPVGWVGSSEGISVELGAPCAIDVDGDAGVFMREDAAASECIVDPDGDLDEDELDAYEDALLSRFAESPEGEPFSGDAAECFIEFAARHHLATIVQLRPHEVRALLLVTIPRHVAIEPEQAAEFVCEVRALLAFAARELGSADALKCLESLRPDTATRMARALADPSCFAPAKAFVMAGARAGYDMTTREGIDAWLKASETRPRTNTKTKPKAKPKAKPKRNKR